MWGMAKSDQRGVALLATLVGVTMLTVAVLDFATSASLSSRIGGNQVNDLRAAYLARSGIQVGLSLLAQDARIVMRRPQPYDALTDIWAVPVPAIPVEGGTVGLRIEDETGKLSLNQLVNPASGALNFPVALIFRALFAQLNIPHELLGALVDWLDRDNVVSPDGAEADYYLALPMPYEPRNGPMPTIGDLRMVRGVTDALFLKLREFVTTAPTTQININTAPPQVIAAVLAARGIDPSLAAIIARARLAQPFTDVGQLAALMPNQQLGVGQLGSVFTTQSVYFSVTGVGTYGGARKVAYAMVGRNGLGPMVLNGWFEN